MKNNLKFKLLGIILFTTLFACQKKQDQSILVENQRPKVNAGADVEIILPANTLVLVGVATDEDGIIKSRLWTQKSGTNIANLINQTTNEVTALAIQAGEYIFEFQVADDKGAVSKDEVKVVVKPAPGVADNPNALRLKQIVYSQSDFINLEYNNAGKLIRYINQYQNNQGNPNSIRQQVFNLEYDEASRLVEITESGNFKTTYKYVNGVLDKTERRNINNDLQDRRSYTFEQGKLKEEIRETRNKIDEWVLIRTQFKYNASGNLTKKTIASKSINEALFVVTDVITYADFDNQKKADNFRMIIPFLPEVVFQVNNPRLMEHRSADGTLMLSEAYTFQYRENGLPKSMTTQNLQVPNAMLTGVLIYE